MTDEQMYTVCEYAGDTLIAVHPLTNEEQTRAIIETWENHELGRYCSVSPELPSLSTNKVDDLIDKVSEGTLMIMEFSTLVGRVRVVTDSVEDATKFVDALVMKDVTTELGFESTIVSIVYETAHAIITDGIIQRTTIDPMGLYHEMSDLGMCPAPETLMEQAHNESLEVAQTGDDTISVGAVIIATEGK